jgi:hypothetical protein
VGKTFQSLSVRLRDHLNEKGHAHKNNWIRSLRVLGLSPTIESLEEVPEDDWAEAEAFWVECLRFYGCRLTNAESGGLHGKRLTEETKAKMRGVKRSQETRDRIRSAKLGKPRSLEARQILSAAAKKRGLHQIEYLRRFNTGKHRSELSRERQRATWKANPMSQEKRDAVSAFHRGRKRSPDTIAKVSAALIGRKRTPEQRARMSAADKIRSQNPAWREAHRKFMTGRKLRPESILKRSATVRANHERAKQLSQPTLFAL